MSSGLSRSRFARTLGLAAGAGSIALSAPVQAAPAGAVLIAATIANLSAGTSCPHETSPAGVGIVTVPTGPAPFAVSGRPVSALERMRAQQAGAAVAPEFVMAEQVAVIGKPSYMPTIAARTMGARAAMTADQAGGAEPVGVTLEPAARFGASCLGASAFSTTVSRPAGSYDFLESRILPVSKTAFDAAWKRVRSAPAGAGNVHAALLAAGQADGLEERIAIVNRWVNARVVYASDRQVYGRSDYWASAGETLRRGKGDCEDYAIAKMQILAAIGVPREDMYLTVARDLVRRDDHAVLIVKLDGRAVMLDNATDTLLDGDRANDYRPILSFSANRSYLHGY